MNTTNNLDAQITKFVSNLAKLDNGERAMLRRELGTPLLESKVPMLFYTKCVPNMTDTNHNVFFFAACASALYQKDRKFKTFTLPKAMKHYDIVKDSSTMHKKLNIILANCDTVDEYLFHKLADVLRMLKMAEIAVDTYSLVKTLIYWESAAVRLNVAKDYVGIQSTANLT